MKIIFTLITAVTFTFLLSFTRPSTHLNYYAATEKKFKAQELLLDINETVDSINSMLLRLSEYKSQVRVNIVGTMIITNNNMQFFNFNLSELTSSGNTSGQFEINGIAMAREAGNRISFNVGNRTVAYIKFSGITDTELENIYELFVHLRSSMLEIIETNAS